MQRVAVIGLAVWAILAPVVAAAGPALVFEAESGNVLSADDADAPWFPASLTKLMTAYVTFRAVRDGRIALDSKIVTSQRARAEPPSKLGLPVGAQIDVETALRTLIVKSANDVAVVLAEGVAGSVEAFVAEMNAVARDLGMTSTRYVNPNGLPDEGQITTARDLALLTRAIIQDFPQYDPMFRLERIKIGKRTLRSHNHLLGKFAGADGMKTGFICASGYNIVASAKRGERRVVAVVLGEVSGKQREERAKTLLSKGFDEAWWKSIVPKKLSDLGAAPPDDERPHHMGPVVCKRRYPAKMDAYAIDARYRAQAQARDVAAAEKEAAGDPPVEEQKSAGRGAGRVAAASLAGIPLPTLRPAR